MGKKWRRLKVVDGATLRKSILLKFVSHGPCRAGWRGDYLKCPCCQFFVLKGGGNHGCPCGNLFVDYEMLRIHVRDSDESKVDTYYATPRPVPHGRC